MGVSTNGQICFGILLEEGVTLPWADDDGERYIDDWWRDQCGYVPTKQLYDEDGKHLPGVTKQDVDDFYKHRREFDAAHPCPVVMVNVCSGDCPVYIIAIPDTVKSARRGYPEKIDRDADFALNPKLVQLLEEFVDKHEIEYEDGPHWYLSSYWG